MSVRFGMDHLLEAREQRGGVVRAGAGLGVVLDGEGGEGFVAEALDGAVIQVDVCDLKLRRKRVREDREVVVLTVISSLRLRI